MADKLPPDNPITEAVNKAEKPKVVSINRAKNKQASNPGETVTWESPDGSYQIINGVFYQAKFNRDGDIVKIPLCNFTCVIVEEFTYQDGLGDKPFFRIRGQQQDGVALPEIEVSLSKFPVMNWPGELWGSKALILSGATKRDNLRVAIILYSTRNGEIPQRRIYGYTGWTKINEAWHYLSGSGAIGANGLDTAVQVDLGGGHMAKYSLPEPPTPEQLKADISALDDLLNVCPNRPEIGATLLAAVARAALGECHIIDFAIFVHGQTGAYKSSITALLLAFFGNFDSRSFPANFSDSDSDLEAKGHQVKDGIYCIDDFKPATNAVEATKLHSKTERFIRNTGNGAGRGRRNPDMTAKAAPFNRSLTIMTGEDLPKGQSILARLLVIELAKNDVHIPTLGRLQKYTMDGAFSRIMAANLQWLAPRLDALKTEFPKSVTDLRDTAISMNLIKSHSRAPEMFANLVAGANQFYEFLADVGMIDSTTKETTQDAIERALITAFKTQSSYQAEQDEVERFGDLLRSVLSSGNGHIALAENQGPPSVHPQRFGYTKNQDTNETKAQGDLFGWYWHKDGKNGQVWLDKNTAHRLISEFSRKAGDPFLMSAITLWRRMDDRELLLTTEKQPDGTKRLDVKRTIAGVSRRVLVISEGWLLPSPKTETSPNAENS